MDTFYLENFYFIESGDSIFEPEYAGKAKVYGSHPPVDILPYSAYIFIEEGFEFVPHPLLTEPKFGGVWQDPAEGEFGIFAADKFTSQYYLIDDSIAMCQFFIPSSHNADAPIDLYNYPFTLMPLNGQCINPIMGASPHKPKDCQYNDAYAFTDCPGYVGAEDLVIGTVSETPVTVKRFVTKNEYQIGNGITFPTYKHLIRHCAQEGTELVLTYVPEELDQSDFYSGAMKRLAVSYGK